MTRRPSAPFAERLALARWMVARRMAQPPVGIADQIDAASREARVLHDRIGAVLPILEPAGTWRQRADLDSSDETRAYLLAVLLGCVNVCIHLRRGGPRPAIARLAERRVDCDRCVATLWRPITAADECDVCERRGVVTFHPFGVRLGPALLVGDCCGDCGGVLGIAQEVAS